MTELNHVACLRSVKRVDLCLSIFHAYRLAPLRCLYKLNPQGRTGTKHFSLCMTPGAQVFKMVAHILVFGSNRCRRPVMILAWRTLQPCFHNVCDAGEMELGAQVRRVAFSPFQWTCLMQTLVGSRVQLIVESSEQPHGRGRRTRVCHTGTTVYLCLPRCVQTCGRTRHSVCMCPITCVRVVISSSECMDTQVLVRRGPGETQAKTSVPCAGSGSTVPA